ncbi:4'-phosphopantetheinyl transferase superfamily protein [Parabacteroides sp. PF5-9]|uniref:4'-phosphopantetheinyl transferase family protein n=1 Tax=Parabacteroides sp. PF5-9 TaxID=1742404 RepID=UPI002473311D|nr:4'-phosphopantetheinyl transferase superfamily protein [Parabacteroides sp. PF5-9]MDH6358667.1 4'-phosphopantetheinyl transferase [Parabacteroides sp. PF5-9]
MPFLLQEVSPLRGIWKIEESSEALLALLGREEEDFPELKQMSRESRRQEWLATRLLLKELWARNYSTAIPSINYHPSGLPFLVDEPFHLSISHTKGYVALLIQEQSFSGIDIEAPSDRIMRIRERFLSEEENASISLSDTINHLFIYWCAKETLFKMIGEQNVDFIDHLHVSPFSYSASGVLKVYETRSRNKRHFKLGYQVCADFIWVWSLIL